MIIALDYDDTFTADKELWTWFVERAKLSGHEVSIVTRRVGPTGNTHTDNADILADAEELGVEIVFCQHQQKEHHFKADVWIDDAPDFIPDYATVKRSLTFLESTGDTKYVRG